MTFDPINSSNSLVTTVNQLNLIVSSQARQLLASYKNCLMLVTNNPNGLTADAINSALDADAASNGRMASGDLAAFASLAKAVINQLASGTIDDSIVAASITIN